ncbi:hypothetical protein QM716_14900 [Rhodococcus sp. IEGM 1409]|uniref:hypothetical protein n=1 Tax=Rhodococcus sp. IEGM 1409 TaxID=3047082 RepID=UPI0024B72BCC|nr:hypothetical protein [Rhodococcus sp. IEGM 1409]MDI9901144.1 hypothetical protein [Rhodococcus sp. IEGM 1409]
MLIGLGALMLAIAAHVYGARLAAHGNYGRRLPLAVGPFSTRAAQHVRRAQLAGWALSLIGTFRVVDNYWETAPLLSTGIAVAVLGAVNGMPSLIITVMHNQSLQRG